MTLLNTKPLRSTKSLATYSQFLFNRYAVYYYKLGIKEVHLIFDTPHKDKFHPKHVIKHSRKDNTKNSDHQHIVFDTETTLSGKGWQAYLNCEECKRSIVEAIGLALLKSAKFWLKCEQKLVLAGCLGGMIEETAWVIQTATVVPQPNPDFTSTVEEASSRIWRHAIKCEPTKVLIYSPNIANVYNMGLGCMASGKNYIIQLSVAYATEECYLHLNNLLVAFTNDPELATLPRDKIGQIMMMLFIVTGCDVTSHFKAVGKASFFGNFFNPFVGGAI